MSSMSKPLICIASVVTLLSAGPPALAGRTGPCAEDVKKLCPGVKGQALKDCMKKHEAQFSPACRAQTERAREMQEACRGDADKFCKGVKPGKGRLYACLKKNEAQLSGACRDAMKPASDAGKPPKG